MKTFLLKILKPAPMVGLFFLIFVLIFYIGNLMVVLQAGGEFSFSLWQQDPFLSQILLFSAMQAGLSALLSVLIGGLFARALFYQDFKGKQWIIKLCSLTFVLPSLVAILGLLGIYGQKGWLSWLCQQLNIPWDGNIYGLSGILLAHLFFNIPLASRMFLQGFASIPNQQQKLAAQLNLRGWQFFRLVEFPYLKHQLLPSLMLIFILCFTSFAIVLTLGGNPKYSTLEVAIYQAIMFDFDLTKAGFYALLQCGFCLLLFSLNQYLAKPFHFQTTETYPWRAKQKTGGKIWQSFFILVVSLFLILPLLNVVVAGIFNGQFIDAWRQSELWLALSYSLVIALGSASLALLMAFFIALLARRLVWLNKLKFAQAILNFVAVILTIPILIIAIGLFLQLQSMDFSRYHLVFILICCNSFSALPFALKILYPPLLRNQQYYEKLCQSLNIKGWHRLRLIEWADLAQPCRYAFALCTCLSLGDFSAIALFGGQDFSSLPYLLYQQLGSYRTEQGATTALLLLILSGLIFYFSASSAQKQKGIQ